MVSAVCEYDGILTCSSIVSDATLHEPATSSRLSFVVPSAEVTTMSVPSLSTPSQNRAGTLFSVSTIGKSV